MVLTYARGTTQKYKSRTDRKSQSKSQVKINQVNTNFPTFILNNKTREIIIIPNKI